MFFSGISDEAGKDADRQIQAHKELGWSWIELRNVGGRNALDLPDEEFAELERKLERAGLRVSCFASQIANWARPISGPLERDIDELRRAMPRMRRLGARFIRVMSYPNADPPWPEAEWRRESIRRMREIAAVAAKGEVVLVHENCSGWGGLSKERTLELLREVDSPHLKLVFDTGNPAQYFQDSWDYYRAVRDHAVYVHVKDYLPREPGKVEQACFPGDGICRVRDILGDLSKRGYDGGVSIEPHIQSVIHLRKDIEDPDLAYRTYLEYGRRLMKLVEEVRAPARR